MNAFEYYPVLVIGFNRSEFVESRLAEVIAYVPAETEIYLSIDGTRSGSVDVAEIERIRDYVKLFSKTRSIHASFHNKNLGCDNHIITAIDKVLDTHEAVIVIEDDVKISSNFYESINAQINLSIQNQLIGTVSGFSPLSDNFKSLKLGINNGWRLSNYYSAWGTGIKKDFWKEFRVMSKEVEILSSLEDSITWRKLSPRQKRIWTRRFLRGNYDFQMQLHLFRCQRKTIFPYFRLVENVGFEDPRSTHTKGKKPRTFLGTGFASVSLIEPKHLQKNSMDSLWRIFDSNTWAGDGIFSVRGRESGIRTHLKSVLNVAKDKCLKINLR